MAAANFQTGRISVAKTLARFAAAISSGRIAN
jgi:hypothetical protein